MVKCIYVCFLFFFFLKPEVQAANFDCYQAGGRRSYYIDGLRGTENGDGSFGNPFSCLSAVNRLQLYPGDNILLAGGQEFAGTIHINKFTGTSNAPLLISSYGEGKAMIYGKANAALTVDSSQYVRVSYIIAKGDGRLGGSESSGIDVKYSNNVYIDSVEAYGFLWNGISTFGGSNITLTDIYAHNNGFNGIEVSGPWSHKEVRNIHIAHCVAENNPGNPRIKDNHSGSGILVAHSTGVLVEYCEAMNNGWDMPRVGNGPVGIWAYECDSLTIQYCFSHDNKTSAGGRDGGGFDFDGGVTNSVMQYNLSMDNEGAGYGLFQFGGASDWTNNDIHHNVSINDGRKNSQAGFFVWCDPYNKSVPLRNSCIHHNLVISSHGHSVSFETGYASGLLFRNNRFLLTGNGTQHIWGDYSQRGVTFSGNTYWSQKAEMEYLSQPQVNEDTKGIYKKINFDIPSHICLLQIKKVVNSFFTE
ncbi:right-handed parallel beta-helix repeat-containing protein [uncultured Bacteroides sp.]|uniref:right-handed parallel beta-helix repeat-containing protein n=1 Tax=uncultured Bacteroides sp. TaxID=162156 RepID=UPI002AA5FA1E|nr:right-handed parallel beta-helix repeat-containing protein [uncultured Bacteroides sp.]